MRPMAGGLRLPEQSHRQNHPGDSRESFFRVTTGEQAPPVLYGTLQYGTYQQRHKQQKQQQQQWRKGPEQQQKSHNLPMFFLHDTHFDWTRFPQIATYQYCCRHAGSYGGLATVVCCTLVCARAFHAGLGLADTSSYHSGRRIQPPPPYIPWGKYSAIPRK